MTPLPLDNDFLKGLLAPKPTTTPKRGTRKKSGFDDTDRSVVNWFNTKNVHSVGQCSNPDCLDDRPRKREENVAMTAEVNGLKMCRICFVAGYGLSEPAQEV